MLYPLLTLITLIIWPCTPASASNLPHLSASAINTEVDAVFAKIDAAQATFIAAAGKVCTHPYNGQSDDCTDDTDCEADEMAEPPVAYRGTCEYKRRYVQVLAALVLRDGTTVTKPALDDKTPSDRTVGMRDLGFTDSDSHRIDYVLDEYYTPDRHGGPRHGYLIHAELEIAGETWRRTKEVGPEDRGFKNSASDWYILQEP